MIIDASRCFAQQCQGTAHHPGEAKEVWEAEGSFAFLAKRSFALPGMSGTPCMRLRSPPALFCCHPVLLAPALPSCSCPNRCRDVRKEAGRKERQILSAAPVWPQCFSPALPGWVSTVPGSLHRGAPRARSGPARSGHSFSIHQTAATGGSDPWFHSTHVHLLSGEAVFVRAGVWPPVKSSCRQPGAAPNGLPGDLRSDSSVRRALTAPWNGSLRPWDWKLLAHLLPGETAEGWAGMLCLEGAGCT